MTRSAITKLVALSISAASACTSFADVEINDNLSLYGYVTATASNSGEDYTGGGSSDTGLLEVDSMKVQLTGTFDDTVGVVSLHAFSDYEPVFLDMYATYSLDDESSLTFGKFLSYHGYEAFDCRFPTRMIWRDLFPLTIPVCAMTMLERMVSLLVSRCSIRFMAPPTMKVTTT